MSAALTLTVFTPGEAHRITGVSTVQQRDWRRHGYLPAHTGHARFDAFALAELWVLKLMADRGIGPQGLEDIPAICARGIVWHALAWPNAYEGDQARVFEWQPELYEQIQSNQERNRALQADLASNPTPEKIEAALNVEGPSWGVQADWLRKLVLKDHNHPRVIPARFFVWWADSSELWCESLNAEFDNMTSDDVRTAGPVIVLDLATLGTTLIDRAQRALVHVEIEAAK